MLHVLVVWVPEGLLKELMVKLTSKDEKKLSRGETSIPGSEIVMCKGPVVGRTLASVRDARSGAGEADSGLSQLGHVARGSPCRPPSGITALP